MANTIISVISALLGTVLGAVLSWRFQKMLLSQQLDFQQKMGEAEAKLRQEIYNDWKTAFTDCRNMVNQRLSQH